MPPAGRRNGVIGGVLSCQRVYAERNLGLGAWGRRTVCTVKIIVFTVGVGPPLDAEYLLSVNLLGE